MRLTVVRPRELGETEIARWRALQQADPALDTPFLSPEFTVTVGELRDQVRVSVVEDDGKIVAFFPFERHPLGIGRPVAAGLTDAQGLVGTIDGDARALLKLSGLGVYEFDHLVAGQPFLQGRHELFPSPIIDLRAGYDAFTRQVGAKTYKSTLAKARRLERDFGQVRHDYAVHDPEPLRTLLAWKTAQYRRTGRSDRFSHPWIVELVDRLAAIESESFAGVLDMVYVDGVPMAGHFGLRTATTLAGWFPAYDPAFAKYSPGLVHHLAMAEQAAAHGIEVIDLGRGEKEYKDKLKNGELRVAEGRVARPGPASAAHWVTRVPLRTARNTVLANPFLSRVADRALKTLGRVRTTVHP
ncbi:GNAT family N-acetyltransferase [Nonomuraea soli]|uniref:CelD/BcsL family acetyltransferase involved in cellulose biosynthesis n=1 Tax=Nonomuraea soli TaxID=1032476 RepID=A0A7W0HS45_9ACTN|nr:GNAT family N-acetyltransferase [Nonomuraea soli]MBA2893635.1 CelD/BcsL family acetyltransferase involved in cellulose biosynthesis [Nonomuraea soli]